MEGHARGRYYQHSRLRRRRVAQVRKRHSVPDGCFIREVPAGGLGVREVPVRRLRLGLGVFVELGMSLLYPLSLSPWPCISTTPTFRTRWMFLFVKYQRVGLVYLLRNPNNAPDHFVVQHVKGVLEKKRLAPEGGVREVN